MYVQGDPVNLTDPDGRAVVAIPLLIGCGLGIAAEAATQRISDGRLDFSAAGLAKYAIGCGTGSLGGWAATTLKTSSFVTRAAFNGGVNSVTGSLSNVANTALDGREVTRNDFGIGAAAGFVGGMAGSWAADAVLGAATLKATTSGMIIVDSAGNAFTVASQSRQVVSNLFGGLSSAGTTVSVMVKDKDGNYRILRLQVGSPNEGEPPKPEQPKEKKK